MKFEIRDLKWVALMLLLVGCGKPIDPLPPGGFIANATLSTNELTVGDPVTLTLTARHPMGSAIHFPNLVATGKEVVVYGRSEETRPIAKDTLESEQQIQLTSFRVGDWNIVTNPVVCAFTNGIEKTQTLPELTLHVQSSLNETNATQLSDIKDIVKPPLRISRKLWIFLLVALLALLAGIVTLALLRKPRALVNLPPPLPPHVVARQALDALRAKPWIPEPFFTELSLILRAYLESRFSLHAPESTTEELTRSMAKDIRLNIKEQQTLRNFLTQADLVKFARAGAEKEAMQNAFSTVEEFVEQTKEDQTDPSDLSNLSDQKP